MEFPLRSLQGPKVGIWVCGGYCQSFPWPSGFGEGEPNACYSNTQTILQRHGYKKRSGWATYARTFAKSFIASISGYSERASSHRERSVPSVW
jgi:hypothetical protein